MDRRRDSRPRSNQPRRDNDYYQETYGDEYESDYDDEYEVAPPRPVRRRRPPAQTRPRPTPSGRPRPSSRPPSRPPQRRRVWPVLLTGCGLGILFSVLAAAVVVFVAFRSTQGNTSGLLPGINSTRPFSKQETTEVPLQTLGLLQICDKVGNVSVKVDPKATSASVTTKKTVQAGSQSDADRAFKNIAVEIQPPGTVSRQLTCAKTQPGATPTSTGTPTAVTNQTTTDNSLTINVTVPETGGLVQSSSNAVDVSVTLPPTILPGNGPTAIVNVEAPVGNIQLDGVSGILNIRGSNGNVTVEHSVLASNSRISTGQGNVTFKGWLNIPPPSTTTVNEPARFFIGSEQGTVDISLPSTTNVTLNANTNVGPIKSEFPITVIEKDSSTSYHGPLQTSPDGEPTASLSLDVSTGTINIHKLQP